MVSGDTIACQTALTPGAGSDPGDSTLSDPPARCFYLVFKTGLDFALALVLLILSLPVILLAALAVKLTSRGPAIYSQTRVGKGGRLYTIHKIRTMVHQCESILGAQWSTPGDPRVTPVGRFLRKTHIDELPQLWNVLRGEMSLVGPRPERPEFVPQLGKAIPRYRDRLLVRPGITGLAQIQLPPDTNLESVRRKLAYDLYYISRMSFWLDLRILTFTGCSLVGIPFALTSWCLRVPRGKVVEGPFESSTPEALAAAELQTV